MPDCDGSTELLDEGIRKRSLVIRLRHSLASPRSPRLCRLALFLDGTAWTGRCGCRRRCPGVAIRWSDRSDAVRVAVPVG